MVTEIQLSNWATLSKIIGFAHTIESYTHFFGCLPISSDFLIIVFCLYPITFIIIFLFLRKILFNATLFLFLLSFILFYIILYFIFLLILLYLILFITQFLNPKIFFS